jgi:diguanylate cyclase (GGDEF)-like protein
VRFSQGRFGDTPAYRHLFLAHIALFLVLGLFLLAYYLMRPKSVDEVSDRHAVLLIVFSSLALVVCSGIALIDQFVSGQITVYVVGCMTLAVAFYLPLRVSVPVYTANHAAFLIGLSFVQTNPDTLISHYVNGTIVVVLAILITKLMFDSQRRVYQGISVIQSQQARLERLALEDSLTGLFNRRYVDSRLEEEQERANRYQRAFSVAMADIDHFKRVNDAHTHSAGDEVLRQIAGLLKAEIRGVDVVARYGGEEFIIIFPETTEDMAYSVCEKIRWNVERHNWHVVADGLAVTISIGVAGCAGSEECGNIVELADERLYEAKRGGRNKVVRGT